MTARLTEISAFDRCYRLVWNFVWTTTCRWTPSFLFHWRYLVLLCFGAKIARTARVYPSAKIWDPRNLIMMDRSCVAANVEVYNVGKVVLFDASTVSQHSVLCTANRDIKEEDRKSINKDIEIGPGAWICWGVFVAPGVTVGKEAVVQARSVVTIDVPDRVIVSGHPAAIVRNL